MENKRSRLGMAVSGLGQVTGLTPIARTVKSTGRKAIQPIRILTNFVTTMRSRKETPDVAHIEDDKERFQEAFKYYGENEELLAQQVKNNRVAAYFYGFVTLAALIWGLYIFNTTELDFFVSRLVFSFAPLFPAVVFAFKHSLNYAQLRDRTLYRPAFFLKNCVSVLSGRFIVPLLAVGIISLGFFPDVAYAQGGIEAHRAISFSVHPDDLFGKLLSLVFPNVGPIPSNGELSPWAEPLRLAFQQFNTILLAFATIMLTYHGVTGVVASAYDGEPLGRNWHTIWAPMRVTLGFGMLAPVANGYALVQVLVLSFAVLGSNIANSVYNAFVSYYNTDVIVEHVKQDTEEKKKAEEEVKKSIEDGTAITASNAATAAYATTTIANHADMSAILHQLAEKQACFGALGQVYKKAYETAQYGTFVKKGGEFPPFGELGKPQHKELVREINAHIGATTEHSMWGRVVDYFNGTDENSKAAKREVSLSNIPFAALDRGYVEPRIINTHTPSRWGGKSDMSIDFNLSYNNPLERGYTIGAPKNGFVQLPRIYLDYGSTCGSIKINIIDEKAMQTSKYSLQSLNDVSAANIIPRVTFTATEVSRNKLDAIDYAILKGYAETTVEFTDMLSEIVKTDLKQFTELAVAAAGNRMIDGTPLVDDVENAKKAYNRLLGTAAHDSVEGDQETGVEIMNRVITKLRKKALDLSLKQEKITNDELTGAGLKSMNEVVQTMGSTGWAGAGSFYTMISRLSEMRYNASQINIWDTTPVDTVGVQGLLSFDIFKPASGNGTNIFPSITEVTTQFLDVYEANESNQIQNFATKAGQHTNVIEMVDEWLGQLVLSAADRLAVDPYTALLDLSEFGYWLLGALSVMLIAGVAAAVKGAIADVTIGVVGKLGFLAGILTGFAGFILKVGIIGLAIVGVLFAYILPVIPYFFHLFAVFGMLLLVAEFMLGSVIHAFMHVRMDGDELVAQQQKQGYVLLFNLILRPTLIVFGVGLSYALFAAMGTMISATARTAFFGDTIGHGVSTLGAMMYLIFASYLFYQAAIRSFSIITELPDRVARWFGADTGLNEGNESQKAMAFFSDNTRGKMEDAGRANLMSKGLGGKKPKIGK